MPNPSPSHRLRHHKEGCVGQVEVPCQESDCSPGFLNSRLSHRKAKHNNPHILNKPAWKVVGAFHGDHLEASVHMNSLVEVTT